MFGKPKTAKSQQPDKSKFTVYIPYTSEEDEFYENIDFAVKKWLEESGKNYIQVVSIDPAIKNYGFRIERRYMTGKIVPLAYCRLCFASINKKKIHKKKKKKKK